MNHILGMRTAVEFVYPKRSSTSARVFKAIPEALRSRNNQNILDTASLKPNTTKAPSDVAFERSKPKKPVFPLNSLPSEIRIHVFEHLDLATRKNLRLVNRKSRGETPFHDFSPPTIGAFFRIVQAYVDDEIRIKSLSIHKIKGVNDENVQSMRFSMQGLKEFDQQPGKAASAHKAVSDGLVEEWPLLEHGREGLREILPEILHQDSLSAFEERAAIFTNIHETDESPQTLEALSIDPLITTSEMLAIAEHRNTPVRVRQDMLKGAISRSAPNNTSTEAQNQATKAQTQALEITEKLIARNTIPETEHKEVLGDLTLWAEVYGSSGVKAQAERLKRQLG